MLEMFCFFLHWLAFMIFLPTNYVIHVQLVGIGLKSI